MIRDKYIDMMELANIDSIRPYGVITHIECNERYSQQYGLRDYGTIDVDIKFTDSASYRQFAHDLRVTQRLKADEALREKYPALKNAWNEYQLLLKLTK